MMEPRAISPASLRLPSYRMQAFRHRKLLFTVSDDDIRLITSEVQPWIILPSNRLFGNISLPKSCWSYANNDCAAKKRER
jgi:hypothetical protein